MLPILNIGPLAIPTAPAVILLGLWVCLTVVERAAAHLGRDVATFYGLASAGLLAGILGARLGFVMLHWSAYAGTWWGIFWPIHTGFDLAAGVIVGVGAMLFYGRWKQISFWQAADILVLAGVVGLSFFSLADFLAGTGYGEVSNLPWAISQYGIRRHPIQIYEILVGLLAVGAWLGWTGKQIGNRALLVWSLYCAGRLFVEAFQGNPLLTVEGLHLIQLICLIGLIGGLVAMMYQSLADSSSS